jgi:MFS superfamily sulfate permease-like transporter
MFGLIQRWIASAQWMLVAAFFALVFIGTGITALFMFLVEYFSPPVAMGIITGCAAFIALIAALVATRRSSSPASPTAGWEAVIKRAAMKDPLVTAIGALAVGLIVESSPELGRIINRLMGRMTR